MYGLVENLLNLPALFFITGLHQQRSPALRNEAN